MKEQELSRKRKIARERIGAAFKDAIEEYGCILVDCGALGHAVVTPDSVGFNIRWLGKHQLCKLNGRID